jgi:hypothetical protein
MFLSLIISASFAASVTVNPGDDIASLTASLGAGSEVVFNDGVYPISSTLTWTGIGTAEAPIVRRAAEGALPVIEYTPPSGEGGWYAVRVVESSYLRVEGLAFSGGAGWEELRYGGMNIDTSDNITVLNGEIGQFGGTLLNVSGNNRAITIEHNHIHDNVEGSGVYLGYGDGTVWTQDSFVLNNWIHDINGSYTGAIVIPPGGQGNTLRDNVIYNVANTGIYTGSTELGAPNVVEANAIWNTVNQGIESYGAVLIRNNLIFNVDGYGIRCEESDYGNYENVVITFNTVVDTGSWALYVEDWAGQTGMVLANNSFCNPIGYGVYFERPDDDTGMLQSGVGLFSSNIVCGLVDNPLWFSDGYSAGGGYSDYVNSPSWNFYPTDGATLVDVADPAGETFVPETDFNGAPREGDTPDVGAYEWSGTDNPGWAVQEGFKTFDLKEESQSKDVGGCCQGDGSGALLLTPLLGLGALSRRRRRAALASPAPQAKRSFSRTSPS